MVFSELVRDGDDEDNPGPGEGPPVSKMLATGEDGTFKEGEFECEPHRNRTCNLLIKSQLLCQLS